MTNIGKKPRDPATQIVEDNLRAILQQLESRLSDVRNHGSATNTAIYDFLSGRTASVKIDTLAKWAKALNVPLIVFLAPPEKRNALLPLMDMAEDLTPDEIATLVALARTLSDMKKT